MAAPKVTISDVAREAGVALGTVSNALNHPEKVRPATLELINNAIDKLGYAPNQSARMLAGGRSQVFGLVLSNFEHGISLQIANGANSEARKHGYGLLVANAANDDTIGTRYLRYFMGTQISGIMVQPLAERGWKAPAVTPSTPTVFLDQQSERRGYYVGADHKAQGKLIAEHAVAVGARHVAVIGADELETFDGRLVGVRTVMVANPDVQFEIVDEGRWNDPQSGFELGRRLAMREPGSRPDFILALSDVLATGAMGGVQAAGLSVPHDIKIAGCDGNPLAWSGSVPLTTVAPPGYEIGRQGILYLIRQIEHERRADHALPRENHQAIVRPFLMARASTGVVRTGDFVNPSLDISGYL